MSAEKNTPARELAYLPSPPVMTVEAFAAAIGLPVGVVAAQVERSYWPTLVVGRRRLLNVEALRICCARAAEEFSL